METPLENDQWFNDLEHYDRAREHLYNALHDFYDANGTHGDINALSMQVKQDMDNTKALNAKYPV